MDEDTPAASATCRCGRNITYQGDQNVSGFWAHDHSGAFLCDDGQPAAPIDKGRLVRCPPTTATPTFDPVSGKVAGTLGGCGATFIAEPADDGSFTCPSCDVWFWLEYAGEQPPAAAQPQEVPAA